MGYRAKIFYTMLSALRSQPKGLGSLGDQSRSKASRTNSHSSGLSLDRSLYFMEVGVPDPSGFVVGMTYIMSKNRPFSADFTNLCHDQTSNLNFIKINTMQPELQAEVNFFSLILISLSIFQTELPLVFSQQIVISNSLLSAPSYS